MVGKQIPGKVLVTGGCGFLGKNLVECLAKQGCQVTVFDVTSKNLGFDNVKTVKGNLLNEEEVIDVFKGHDLVFHMASPSQDSDTKTLENVNVQGTKNVIKACKKNNIKKLVFTSSASVVFAGEDQYGVDETVPYPSTFRDEYSRTKTEAEKLILQAGANGGLATVSIRPHGIFGPYDGQLVPTLVEMAQKKKTRFAIGDTSNVVDFTYVGNVVHAHLLAAERCESPKVNGKCYFVTNDEPVRFWEFMSWVLDMLEYDPPSLRLPYKLIWGIAYIADAFAKRLDVKINLSPSRIVIAATHHWYCCEAAKKDLEYKPLWSLKEGLFLTKQFFKHFKNPHPRNRKKDNLGDDDSLAKAVDENNLPLYSPHEVARHNTKDDLWIIVDGYVYDITKYAPKHPGGDAIFRKPGQDNSEGFHGDQHPDTVNTTIKRYLIGRIKTAADDPPVPDKTYTREEVATHTSETDCWIIIDDVVYDISTFVPKHPGGADILLQHAGQDATKAFYGPQHPPEVKSMIYKFVRGRVAD